MVLLPTITVEQVSGQSLADYLGEHVFDPLGMGRSGYDPASVSGQPNVAVGYARGKDGAQPVAYPSLDVAGGAGALYGTVSDLYRWDRALYTEELVSRSAFEQIFYPGNFPSRKKNNWVVYPGSKGKPSY